MHNDSDSDMCMQHHQAPSSGQSNVSKKLSIDTATDVSVGCSRCFEISLVNCVSFFVLFYIVCVKKNVSLCAVFLIFYVFSPFWR
eukprot:UN13020